MIADESSKMTDLTKEMVEDLTEMSVEEYSKKRHIARIKFPSKLMWLLDDGRYNPIIRWSEDGKSVVITNKFEMRWKVLKALSANTVPPKFESFVKKLRRWGFDKHPNGDIWEHSKFRRGHRGDLAQMKVELKETEKATAKTPSLETPIFAPTPPCQVTDEFWEFFLKDLGVANPSRNLQHVSQEFKLGVIKAEMRKLEIEIISSKRELNKILLEEQEMDTFIQRKKMRYSSSYYI